MKRITLFILSMFILALVLAATSCTKDKGTSSSSGYSCNCEIHWNGGDSTTSTRYGNISASEATGQCNDELQSLQAKYGYGTSSTGSQWVICNVQ